MSIDMQQVMAKPVYPGQQFSNYVELCKYIGIDVTQGKARQLDQRHLQCYFTWRKAEKGHTIIVVETFYDAPKVFPDRREGRHTTELGGMLQAIILSTEWKADFYSISSFLYELGLFTKEQSKMSTRIGVEKIYSSRLTGRFESAIKQINKKEHNCIPKFVVNLDTGELLPEEEWEHFRQIKREVLSEFGGRGMTEGRLYWNKRYPEYERRLYSRTASELGQSRVNERYWMKGWRKQAISAPTLTEFLKVFAQDMIESYRGGLGIKSKEEYKKNLQVLIDKLPHRVEIDA